MAKITARGDREARRYKTDDGRTMVVTERGRVLRKLTPASGYNVIDVTLPRERRAMLEAADRVAAAMGYEAASC